VEGDPKHQDPTHSPSYNSASRDPLGRLPPEILTKVFIHLPAQSVVNMKITSPAARHIPLSNWFWWKRIKSAMPCLWDLPSFHGLTGSENIDWDQVYKDLSIQGRGHGHGKTLGLVNRHRIWREWELRTWFEEKANSAEQDVTDTILEWGDCPFREWRAAGGQTAVSQELIFPLGTLHINLSQVLYQIAYCFTRARIGQCQEDLLVCRTVHQLSHTQGCPNSHRAAPTSAGIPGTATAFAR
jgi:hypothetical protein